METAKLKKAEAWPIVGKVFPNYRGRKFKLQFTETIMFSNIHWGGGSRNRYGFVRADRETAYLPASSPWDSPFEGKRMDLPQEILVVQHTFFCGKDLGCTIYAHPIWAPKLLPKGGV